MVIMILLKNAFKWNSEILFEKDKIKMGNMNEWLCLKGYT